MAPVANTTSQDHSDEANDGVDQLNDTEADLNRNNDEETTQFLVRDHTNRSGNTERVDQRQSSRRENCYEPDESENDTEHLEEDNDDTAIIVDEVKAPDGGWGWLIVLGALLVRTVIGGLGRSHGLFYIKFKERFDGPATSTALVTSLTGFLRLSAGPLVSILSGRFQCRVLTSLGTVVLFLGLILTGFGPNLQFLYFSYGVVAGLGRAFTLTPVPILLGYYFNKRRSLAFGLASAGFSIGGFAITPVVELLFQHFGYQGTFLILGGFALNILVASALFRPIEVHRKLASRNRYPRKTNSSAEVNSLTFKSLEHIESGAVLGSSTISINRLHVKSSEAKINSTSSVNQPLSNKRQTTISETKHSLNDTDHIHHIPNEINITQENIKTINTSAKDNIDDYINGNEQDKSDNEETVLQKCTVKKDSFEDSSIKEENTSCTICCVKRKSVEETDGKDGKKKQKLISWSVLKDTRFQCYVFATFCFTLPSSTLFLPALAKSKGATDIQAASLLSISAGVDTVFRVLSGVVLDLKVFRSVRPLIYNGVTFLQGTVVALFPLMTNYEEFMVLSAIDGAVQGTKMAQGTVIMMDILGVDKLASSMAITMTVQCVAVFLGPTISGQLIDTFGTYNGAFYFGSGAILLGGLVLAVGNIAKHCNDRKAKDTMENNSDISS